MEIEVCIVQAGMKDAPRFNLRCRARAAGPGNASGETHEGSVSVAQPPTGTFSSAHNQPKFAFSFASNPAQISLLFVAMSSRLEPVSSLPTREQELGRCEGTLATVASEKSQTLLLSQQISGTGIERFVGKLKYTVHLCSAAGTDLASIMADETKRACASILPSDSPFVCVVFHYAYTTVDQTQELVGVARIGARNDIRTDTILQSGARGGRPEPLRHISLLKPVRLSSQECECLELHVVDSRSGAVLFSASRALNRLAPFKPVHYMYDRQSFHNPAHTTGVPPDTRAPRISVSVVYTPSLSEFKQFEGLEVAVCEINLPTAMQYCRDVVLGVQLVQKDSKKKIPSLGSGSPSQPPFQALAKKGKAASDMDHDYHVSVIRYRGNDLTSTIKSYLFFPFVLFTKKLGVYLMFHVYGSSGSQLWWNTDNCASMQLEISETELTQLQGGEIPWNVTNKDLSQPCSISGIMRWKLKQMPFLTESMLTEALSTPVLPPDTSSQTDIHQVYSYPLNETESQESVFLRPKHEVQSPQRALLSEHFDPASLQKTLEGLATPTQNADTTSRGDQEDTDVLSHMTKFESTFQQMASDYRTLRRENQRLQADNEQLLLQMAQLKSVVTVSPREQSALQLLSESELILKIGSLQQSLAAEERAHERCQKRFMAVQSDLNERQGLETQYVELQEAHTAQQKLVKLLRGKVEKYHKCSDVCRKQEAVITQLESLLIKQAEGHPSARDDAISLLSKENAQLRALQQQSHTSRDGGRQQAALLEKEQTIRSLKSELSQLVSRCQQLEQEKLHGVRNENKREFETKVFELEQKLLVAEAKLSAQTNQLQENAEQWMLEKAHYEVQLADFRNRLDTVIRSGQHVLSTTQGAGASTTGQNAGPFTVQGSRTRQDSGGLQRYFSGKTNTKDFSF